MLSVTGRTAAVPPSSTYWRHVASATPGRTIASRTRPVTARTLTGRKYFRQVAITWSIRSRGRLHRTHIITSTSTQHLARKTTRFNRVPGHRPNSAVSSNGRKPVCQPPR